MYRDSHFQCEPDRDMVTALLREMLKRRLPARREYMPYVGEWKYNSWTDDDFQSAFASRLPVNSLTANESWFWRRFDMKVPVNIDEAVHRNYKITRMKWRDRRSPFSSFPF